MASSRWWTKDTVAVVTGGNKGIGFEIVKQLAKQGLTVVLAARDELKGLAAAEELKKEGLNVVFQSLNVLSKDSTSKFASWVNHQFGGLDILVNNAAIMDREVTYESAQKVMETNYAAVKTLTKDMIPLMKASTAGARIINISSELGQLERLKNPSLRAEIENINSLTEEKADALVERYLDDVKAQRLDGKGWPYNAYSVSKMALNAYTRVLAKSLPNIYVNCVTPGYCKTDLTGNRGTYSAKQGAETPVWVALLPPGGPTGQFFFQKNAFSF